ncbi:MAG TPA: malonyl-ACP O-methyltransferase BioC [Desulfitobacteriaceae bacterium]|nr:malonyl-ACP O-methyltransferase BioC [Desulfitobacteriaceae bacterium]
MVNKLQVQENFGKYAVSYDRYAVIQKEMAGELLEVIGRTGRYFGNILEIGCGTGFLTELLAVKYPKAQITATDIAPEMITVAREKLANFPNIKYFTADGENLSSQEHIRNRRQFDLIVSNAVFQWFSDYQGTFSQFHSYLEYNGYLIFSTLGSGTFKELYVCLKEGQVDIIPGKQAKQESAKKEPFIENKHLEKIMISTGFENIGLEETTKQEYFKSCRDFLKSLKMIGAHNYLSDELSAKGLGSGIFSLIKNYDSRFSGVKGIPATYQCLYGWGLRTT